MDMKKKAMSDGEVNDYVFDTLSGDLDDIEGKSMFSEDKAPEESPNEGVKMEAGGYSIHVKPMAGEQVKDQPAIEDAPEEDDELGKLGL